MKTAITSLALLAIAAPAPAEEFNVVHAGKSTLVFVSTQMGVPVEGRFGHFSAQLRFDPARLAAASLVIDVDLAGIDAGSREANDELATRQWFDSKAHPTARFVSSAVRALGGNRYEASGKLTIKNRTKDLTVPFAFNALGHTATADGSFAIRRADFALGEGSWSDFTVVANEVQIKFRLQAEAMPNRK